MSISIITCVYNQSPEFFGECAHSVSKQNQPLEWIIVDNGSNQVLQHQYQYILKGLNKKVKMRYIKLDGNKGLSVSRNIGLKEARGDWVVVLDSDDRLAPDLLENLLKVDSDFSLVCFEARYFDDYSSQYRPNNYFEKLFKRHGKTPLDPFLWFDFYYHGIICRRKLLEKICGYNEGLFIGEDQDILLRAIEEVEIGQVKFIHTIGYEYRINPAGVCETKWKDVLENYLITMLAASNRRGGNFIQCRYGGTRIFEDADIDCYHYLDSSGVWIDWEACQRKAPPKKSIYSGTNLN